MTTFECLLESHSPAKRNHRELGETARRNAGFGPVAELAQEPPRAEQERLGPGPHGPRSPRGYLRGANQEKSK